MHTQEKKKKKGKNENNLNQQFSTQIDCMT